ncbi:divalent metal cation transporter [Bacillus sp. NP157]|nr:divalent metal cation transporter [Bacillus sp. NP157]
MSAKAKDEANKPTGIRRFFNALGPGLTAGAADDDPSGVATFSIVGAKFGTQFLWTALLTWPLMAVVQMMCARVGMVTGMGLGGALRERFPRWLVGIGAVALLGANLLNIAADLGGMGDAMEMLHAGPALLWVWVFGIGICLLAIRLRYYQLASVLKWLAMVLLAYVVTAFLVKPHWTQVAHDTFIPTLPKGNDGWSSVVALFGTTISPFLFFWQASQEVEEDKAKGRRLLSSRRNATKRELGDRKLDVWTGTFFSNLVMFFIILTAAFTLHTHGKTVETVKDAASALQPLAGRHAFLLFTGGLVGAGLLAIPTLAGSAAYAFAETFDWVCGLDKKFHKAVSFYAVFIIATIGGALFDVFDVDPVKTLFWSAVVNGILAPFLLVGLLLITGDRTLMQGQPSPTSNRIVVGLTAALMFAGLGAMVFLGG